MRMRRINMAKGRVLEMKMLFAEDAAAFVENYLTETDVSNSEMGMYTLTTR